MTAQTILPANTLSSGFDVDNSCRFDNPASGQAEGGTADDTLIRTPDAASNRRTFTISLWMKRTLLQAAAPAGGSTLQQIIGQQASGYFRLTLGSNEQGDILRFYGGNGFEFRSKIFIRDVSAWYHIVLAMDTTQGTAANRAKLYVNGVQQTEFYTANYPDQNVEQAWNVAAAHRIASGTNAGGSYSGYLCEVVNIDGAALAPTSFGEFDEDSGIWKPIDVSKLTFGTNGFHLDFKNSSELGTDVSGNGNTFAETGLTAINQTTDTCTNNFCTMNPLANFVTAATISDGALTTNFANGRGACTSNHGLTTGKWYVEMNITTMPKDERFGLGISPFETKAEDLPHDVNNQGIDLSGYNAVIYANTDSGSGVIDNFFGNNTTRFDSFTGIIGMALDLTSATKTIAFSKAGAWVTGGGTSDTDFSNALKVDISTAFARHQFWHIACGTGNGDGTNGIFSMNFGNPTFAGTDQSDGNGFGSFEYAVPSGYLALCTKNLARTGG